MPKNHPIAMLLAAGLIACSCSQQHEVERISGLQDLDGKTLVVLGGSVQDLLLTNECPNSTILRCETETDCYTMVKSGKAAALLHSGISWEIAKGEFPEIVQVGPGINPQPIGVIFNKKDDALLERFNIFLENYLDTVDINVSKAQWSDPASGKRMPDPKEVDNDKDPYSFVTSAIAPPFDFIRDGEVCGAEAEILARFAISEGRRWKFANIPFSGLIAAIQSGKADIGCSIMSITPERGESVNFSIPWTSEASVLLVNEKFAPEDALADSDSQKKGFFQSVKDSLYKSLVKEDRYKMLLKGLWATLAITFIAAIIGTLLGMLLCFTSLRKNKVCTGSTNAFISIIGCMPQVVFLMIMYYIIFAKSSLDGLWVASIAFALCFGASTSVVFRSALTSIDKGQTEAALSMGFGKFKAFWHIILPQTVQRVLPVYKGEIVSLIKSTAIVGYIAVFDLTKAGDIIRSRTYEAFFPLILVTLMYVLVIWLVTLLLKGVERKTMPKRKKLAQ